MRQQLSVGEHFWRGNAHNWASVIHAAIISCFRVVSFVLQLDKVVELIVGCLFDRILQGIAAVVRAQGLA